jgi:hypothetical protein
MIRPRVSVVLLTSWPRSQVASDIEEPPPQGEPLIPGRARPIHGIRLVRCGAPRPGPTHYEFFHGQHDQGHDRPKPSSGRVPEPA